MKIQRIHIKNFKSIVDLEIIEPNPFTVFVGPNGSGKSNIFEALEFFWGDGVEIRLFGGAEKLQNRILPISENFKFFFQADIFDSGIIEDSYFSEHQYRGIRGSLAIKNGNENEQQRIKKSNSRALVYEEFRKNNTSRIFIRNTAKQKINYDDDSKLNFSASNLEKVLKRILQDDEKKQEIREWLDLFIPGFERVEIVSSELSSTDTLVMYEKGVQKPFTKDLLSDGTYNILALLTAVYQSDQPQFLCIEEPENGLNPYVIRKLVDFFRDACEEKGHYIWLNTHSGTLVDCLTPEEVILVDKAGGQTQIKQLKGLNLHGLDMAEAWLSGALGGGTPW
ncbi:AAA family ATPase [Runella zeae]|uniref:AAA family ATPase n=1 Tax=Runella zeae TaxID=94255 RepID=UPI002357549D|nr:AAA family ATPase [Runella zeae]